MLQIEITCIGCPMGCNLVVHLEEVEVISVKGNSCAIGIEHAKKECTNPTRTVTSTIPILGGEFPRLPVKTEKAIPKNKIRECIDGMKAIYVKAPVYLGDVICKNIAGTEVNIIATQTIKEKQ